MNCMKCGRETEESQVFCPGCLEEMARYPVKPDVIVNLPDRKNSLPKKPAPHKRTRTPEEQISRLKKRNRQLSAVLCLMVVLAAVLAFLSVDIIRQLDIQRLIGQNYSTVETIE